MKSCRPKPDAPGWFRLALIFAALLSLFSTPDASGQTAQNGTDLRIESEALITRAEDTLQSDAASVSALETLRSQLVELRDRNAEIVQRGSVAGRALQAQLDALGPPPEDGAEEAPEIADRRAQLRAEIARANAPVRNAQETVERAQLLIGELDRTVRLREQQRLFTRYPTPLLPSAWITTGAELKTLGQRIFREIASELQSPSNTARVRGELPIVAALAGFAFIFLVFLQPAILRRLQAISQRSHVRSRRWAVLLVANLSRIVLPAIGATALLLIIPLLDITPNSLTTMAQTAPALAVFIIVAHWLGHTLFSPTAPHLRLLALADDAAWRGLRLCQGLGVLISIGLIFGALRRDNTLDNATVSVLSAPLVLLIAFCLWQLSSLFRRGARNARKEDSTDLAARQFDAGFLFVISTLMRIASIAAVVLIVLGYVELSRYFTIPMILTIAQFGLGLFLFHLFMAVFHAFLDKDKSDGQDAMLLIPFGVIFLLVLLFAPLLALTWGARVTDISEIWRLLTEGVEIGEIRLSLDTVIILVVVFVLGALFTRWLQRLLRVSVLPRTRLDPGARTALVTGIGYAGLILSALIAVSTAGLNLSSLAVIFGALSVGIGFGLQAIVSNFVSGIILLIERPIKEGDWIEVSGYSGFVRKIAVRSTRLETFDRHDVIIPNSDLITGTVKNMTLTTLTGRLIVPVGVAYGSDLEQTRSILNEIACNYPGALSNPEPQILFVGLGDNSLDFEIRLILRDVYDVLNAKSEILFQVCVALEKAGIEIPFPQRDIHLRDIDKLVAAIAGRSPEAPKETETGNSQ